MVDDHGVTNPFSSQSLQVDTCKIFHKPSGVGMTSVFAIQCARMDKYCLSIDASLAFSMENFALKCGCQEPLHKTNKLLVIICVQQYFQDDLKFSLIYISFRNLL